MSNRRGPQSLDPMYEPDKAFRRIADSLDAAGLMDELEVLDEIRTALASTIR